MEQPAPGRLPEGLRVYAIGDVHGCAGRLLALHAAIAEDWEARPAARCALVHLGDYVDRGPDSAAVIEALCGPGPLPRAERIDLLGNHEAMMMAALKDGPGSVAEDLWLWNAGDATLASYGPKDGPLPAGHPALPARHRAFLDGLRLSWTAGDYLFVHAGIDPRKPLAAQRAQDLLWIREPFLSWPRPLPAVVVHGHTPCRAPELRPNRIGIDTGAVAGGPLTCLVLEAARLRFLSA
ncbi:serine/threonine protein phosphatase [Pseudoroseomonas deserti]|uniref:Serine/threonine protein phosphatase n=1 Tax=Teichococcus deserti TaxID=1817963 RepID=A0A1V2GXC3_9PROT|nr:metallophosphoesterase family protein [Pseudoroseomonas deserti]ONG48081.1 serine/threonine protein phosphatase [Pseudoroseomonas deserti]